MNDLIERDKAIAKTFCTTVDGVPRMVVLLDDIKAIPSADVPTTMTGVIDAIHEAEYRGYMKAAEDRPKGEWIVNMLNYESICSVCGANESDFIYGTEMWYGLGKSKFCPNCGAKMKGADDA